MQAHNEEHTLQRGGSVSHRRAQSDCLQNRLPITQHFGKVRSDWAISRLHLIFCRSIHSYPHHYLICLFPTASCPVLHLHLFYCCCLAAIRRLSLVLWGNILCLCFVAPRCQSRPRRPAHKHRAGRDERDMKDADDPWSGWEIEIHWKRRSVKKNKKTKPTMH